MGLDIYAHIVKKTRNREDFNTQTEYINALREDADEAMLEELKADAKEGMKSLRKAEREWKKNNPGKEFTMDDIRFEVNNFIYKLSKYFRNDFETKNLRSAGSIKELGDYLNKLYKYYYKPCDLYFRKVNCVYRYFEDRLEDESCFIEKSDAVDIMERAIKILTSKDTELAEELLPTREGFFFGGTEYNEWYYQGLVEILSEFGGLLSKWDDGDLCYIHMSW